MFYSIQENKEKFEIDFNNGRKEIVFGNKINVNGFDFFCFEKIHKILGVRLMNVCELNTRLRLLVIPFEGENKVEFLEQVVIKEIVNLLERTPNFDCLINDRLKNI